MVPQVSITEDEQIYFNESASFPSKKTPHKICDLITEII